MPKHDRKGRSLFSGRYLALPFDVLDSAAFVELSVASRAILIEIGRVYNGHNNGQLALSVRQAAQRCGISKDTVSRAIQELEDAGFIETVEKGGFRQGPKYASTFRLLWLRCDLSGKIPTRRYRAGSD